uniref:Uncharacterized protein n=1 Tax=Petromyzon marinus TaxID=7757 RepID=S4RIU1_PETMA
QTHSPRGEPTAMPCVQAQYGSSPQGASPAGQSYSYSSADYNGPSGSGYGGPEFAKFGMDLSNTTEITATTSLPSFSTFMDSYSGGGAAPGYDIKPPCLYQMEVPNPQISVKMEDIPTMHGYHHHHHHHHHHPGSLHTQSEEMLPSSSSMYFKSSPPSTPTTSGYRCQQPPLWDEPPPRLPSMPPSYMGTGHIMDAPQRKDVPPCFSVFAFKQSPPNTPTTSSCQMAFDGPPRPLPMPSESGFPHHPHVMEPPHPFALPGPMRKRPPVSFPLLPMGPGQQLME